MMTKRKLEGVLIKISEECGETVQRVSKILLYGIDNRSPKVTPSQTNRELLVEELGDILANIQVLIDYTDSGIKWEDVIARKEAKLAVLPRYLPEA